MKKLLTMFAAVVLLLGMTMSAQAGLITITFDEPGINLDDIITTQYTTDGVNWIPNPFVEGSTAVPNQVVNGTITYFSNVFPTYGQILQYNTKPAYGYILVDNYADSLSFQYRRPSSSGDITLQLFDYDPDTGTGTSLTLTPFTLTWTPDDPNNDDLDWATFTYNGEEGNFNLIAMNSTNKFVIDNMQINAVPIPPAFVLLASGLLMLLQRRKS
ncbi:exported hypothetical protein [uncultured Desulfobacterium sp.]|uniref:PEP-CTERM protein-sorting domain-containing protein n=1 Tax=uncultured Desulfobacterium sp. TaxID=201089 RepID=A0A445N110_9BACT|nr:exported hypothetical protein [uncultured Desulfobacterium sp.]